MKKIIIILSVLASSAFAATPAWDTITINQAIAGVWSSTATTIATGTLVLPKSIPDGTLQGTAAIIEGGTVGDANWSHLLITDTDKSVGRGGSITFSTGSGETIDPIASIKAVAEGDAFGSLGFFTRPDGGTNTQFMTILSTGLVYINNSLAVGTPTITQSGAYTNEIRGNTWIGSTDGTYGLNIGLVAGASAAYVGIVGYDAGVSNYGSLSFSAGNFNQLYLDTNGSVGIGTVSPSQALDVVGSIKTDAGVIFPAAGTITIDTTVYYPHDTAGVLSWTTTP